MFKHDELEQGRNHHSSISGLLHLDRLELFASRLLHHGAPKAVGYAALEDIGTPYAPPPETGAARGARSDVRQPQIGTAYYASEVQYTPGREKLPEHPAAKAVEKPANKPANGCSTDSSIDTSKLVGKHIHTLDPEINSRLGCALAVSTALHGSHPEIGVTSNNRQLEKTLTENGYASITLNRPLKETDLQPGDVLIGKRAPGMPGHAAIYQGGGKTFENNSNTGTMTDGGSIDYFNQQMHDKQGHWNGDGFEQVTILRRAKAGNCASQPDGKETPKEGGGAVSTDGKPKPKEGGGAVSTDGKPTKKESGGVMFIEGNDDPKHGMSDPHKKLDGNQKEIITSMTPKDVGMITKDTAPLLTAEMISLFKPETFAAISNDIRRLIKPEAMAGMTPKEAQALKSDQASHLTSEQIDALSPAVRAIILDKLPKVSSN